jgi:glycosyltransferase involved in cell wall biosynthesis
MRVLLLTDRFLPEPRANAHLFHELGTGLLAHGHEVTVVTRMPGDYLPDGAAARIPARERLDGLDVVRVRGLSALWRAPVMRAADQLTVGLAFARAARRVPPADVVLIYSPPLPLTLSGMLYQRWSGAPWALNLHDFYPQTAVDLGLLRNRLAIRAAERLERFAYARAARIVVPAARSREVLVARKGIAPDKIALIANWADLETFAPGPKENAFRRAHGLDGRFVVSYAGVMGFAQDLGPLIEAARLVHDRPEIVFLLVGTGVQLDRWRRRAEGLANVRFLPMLAKHDYFALLSASDVCAVPLARALETPAVPGKIQRIMAAGRPVLAIVSPIGDAAALIEASRCGIAVGPESPEAVARAIRDLQAQPALATALGANGRAYAEKHFSREEAVRAYETILQAVAGTRRAAGTPA